MYAIEALSFSVRVVEGVQSAHAYGMMCSVRYGMVCSVGLCSVAQRCLYSERASVYRQ